MPKINECFLRSPHVLDNAKIGIHTKCLHLVKIKPMQKKAKVSSTAGINHLSVDHSAFFFTAIEGSGSNHLMDVFSKGKFLDGLDGAETCLIIEASHQEGLETGSKLQPVCEYSLKKCFLSSFCIMISDLGAVKNQFILHFGIGAANYTKKVFHYEDGIEIGVNEYVINLTENHIT